mmetsp:Transcript_36982/g.35695  ORF Transcript_36982/g.35695 Transcript_36982/m.35695 type:complete len:257 (+) Transcript_36982:2377-3147(+)
MDVQEEHEEVPHNLHRGLRLLPPAHVPQYFGEPAQSVHLEDLQDLELRVLSDQVQHADAEDVQHEVDARNVLHGDFLWQKDFLSKFVDKGCAEVDDDVHEEDEGEAVDEDEVPGVALVVGVEGHIQRNYDAVEHRHHNQEQVPEDSIVALAADQERPFGSLGESPAEVGWALFILLFEDLILGVLLQVLIFHIAEFFGKWVFDSLILHAVDLVLQLEGLDVHVLLLGVQLQIRSQQLGHDHCGHINFLLPFLLLVL